MDVVQELLTIGFRHPFTEPNVESAFERFAALSHYSCTLTEFCEAVGACSAQGLIREPVRIPDGALQCCWRLELTPKGVATARSALAGSQTLPDTHDSNS